LVTLMSAAVLGGGFFAMVDGQSFSGENVGQQYGTAAAGKKCRRRFEGREELVMDRIGRMISTGVVPAEAGPRPSYFVDRHGILF
jgi:hypothetical protein